MEEEELDRTHVDLEVIFRLSANVDFGMSDVKYLGMEDIKFEIKKKVENTTKIETVDHARNRRNRSKSELF